MQNLSVKQLLEILNQAIELNLKQDFIYLLFNELRERFNSKSLKEKGHSRIS
jgi:hypothetical protein